MDVLLHPTYFPNIAHFVAMLQADHIIFEVCDNYQKQTYRNRTTICGANGTLDLNVPVIYSQKNRQLYSKVEIFNVENWQKKHLKSLKSAYHTSPFFEFYIDELMPLFELKATTLMDFNFKSIAAVFSCMQLPFKYSKTHHFELEPKHILDARSLVNCRKETPQHFTRYTQVFDEKHNFFCNSGILDLLFNEGPNTELYLEKQRLNI